MHKLGGVIFPMKASFIVAHLHPRQFVKAMQVSGWGSDSAYLVPYICLSYLNCTQTKIGFPVKFLGHKKGVYFPFISF